MTPITRYSHRRESGLSFADALAAARAALAAEGFGVLCEIDVQAILQANLGVTREPCAILGACNPALAGRALTIEPELGVLLACNVVARRDERHRGRGRGDAGRGR